MKYTLEKLVSQSTETINQELSGVITLDLSDNFLGFHNQTEAEIATAFARIPVETTHLNLSNNSLGFKDNFAKLIVALTKLSPKVTHLDLSANLLGDCTSEQLIELFSNLPEGLTHLNLSSNAFLDKSSTELEKIFAAIPKHLREIILSKGDISCRPSKELQRLGQALPYFITVRIVNSEQLPQMVPMLTILNNSIGHWLFEVAARLNQLFPSAISSLILQTETGATPQAISRFIQSSSILTAKPSITSDTAGALVKRPGLFQTKLASNPDTNSSKQKINCVIL